MIRKLWHWGVGVAVLTLLGAVPMGKIEAQQSSLRVQPYKFLILADSGAISQAEEFVSLMKRTAPFNQMGKQIVFEIKTIDPKKMNCKSGCSSIQRLICCDIDYALKEAAPAHAHRVLIATSTATGGAGGRVAIAGTGYPPSTLLHELLHTYGLDDEYEYTISEAKQYCQGRGARSANVVSIRPREPYASDEQARALHGSEIPWFGEIQAPTLITSGTDLGTTPMASWKRVFASAERRMTVGLYEGGSCNRVIPTWKPYFEDNIMKNLSEVVIPPLHTRVILETMASERGGEIQLVSDQVRSTPDAPSSVTRRVSKEADVLSDGILPQIDANHESNSAR